MNDLLRRWLFLPPQASTYALGVDLLHYAVIGTTMLGATVVLALAVHSMVRYRQRTPYETTPRVVTSPKLESSLIAFVLVLFLVFWAIGAKQYNGIMVPPANAASVYVSAKQWMWKFSYDDGSASLDTLVVPVGRPIQLVMTSRDVIHSFYVPAFRMKQDVVPGRTSVAWFQATISGVYEIECAEYCGVSHSRMLGHVRVLEKDDYARWLSDKRIGVAQDDSAPTLSRSNLAAEGRDVAARRACFSCHTEDGQPHIGPSWGGLFGSQVRLTNGATAIADEAYITRSMMDPQAEVVAGYTSVMPTYRGVLEEPEVAALVEFIKSIRDKHAAPSVALPRFVVEPPKEPER